MLKTCLSSSSRYDVTEKLRERAEGCLLGQAIGDALGARYEFRNAKRALQVVEMDMDNGFLPIKGGGHTRVKPGQVTDDTELALALARSLLRKRTYVSEDVANSYVQWFESDAIGIGSTTAKTLKNVVNIKGANNRLIQMLVNSSAHNRESLSNGILMRISPLSIAGYNWSPEIMTHVARSNCFLTNPNPTAQQSVACYVMAVHTALHGGTRQEIFDAAFDLAKDPLIRTHFEDARTARGPTRLKNDAEGNPREPVAADSKSMGYLGVAIQIAFYELLNGESFETSMVNIMKGGGDTDTTGCITGALLGAFYGLPNIPQKWVETVINADMSQRLKNPDAKLFDLKEVAVKLLSTREPTKKTVDQYGKIVFPDQPWFDW